jgi:endonuclease/exonuclease/phosphatase family metal-dependent hydrolase
MKIMTLNLNFYESKHGEWSVRRDLIVATIEKHAPEIVALQAVRCDPAGEPMWQLAAAGWSDVWAHLRNNDLGYTFESNAPDKRIDYIWASRDVLPSIKSIELVTEPANRAAARLSDHLGLLVIVLLGASMC